MSRAVSVAPPPKISSKTRVPSTYNGSKFDNDFVACGSEQVCTLEPDDFNRIEKSLKRRLVGIREETKHVLEKGQTNVGRRSCCCFGKIPRPAAICCRSPINITFASRASGLTNFELCAPPQNLNIVTRGKNESFRSRETWSRPINLFKRSKSKSLL